MYKIDSFQYKCQFHYVFNVNPGNQGSRNFLEEPSISFQVEGNKTIDSMFLLNLTYLQDYIALRPVGRYLEPYEPYFS
jgi:hypothetical protein